MTHALESHHFIPKPKKRRFSHSTDSRRKGLIVPVSTAACIVAHIRIRSTLSTRNAHAFLFVNVLRSGVVLQIDTNEVSDFYSREMFNELPCCSIIAKEFMLAYLDD